MIEENINLKNPLHTDHDKGGDNPAMKKIKSSSLAFQSPESNWAEVEENDRRAAAMHEAGHYAAARYLNLDSQCYIVRVGNPSVDDKAYVGQTRFTNTTKFNTAIIGWAGIIAEQLHRSQRGLEVFPTKPDLDFYLNTLDLIWEQSDTDQECFGHGGELAFKNAWKIVVKNKDRIKFMAEKMMAEPGVSQSED